MGSEWKDDLNIQEQYLAGLVGMAGIEAGYKDMDDLIPAYKKVLASMEAYHQRTKEIGVRATIEEAHRDDAKEQGDSEEPPKINPFAF